MSKTGNAGKLRVAVYGAGGHTGRFVVAELLRRGMQPVAVGRSDPALASAGFADGQVIWRTAAIDDADALDHAFAGVVAVINCAGAFLDTAEAVASAALRCGAHYLDVTAEQPSAAATLSRFDGPARAAGVSVIPAMGFYGGLADLLATAVTDGWDAIDAVDVMIGLDHWHPTRGTRLTGERNKATRLVVEGGELVPVASPPRERGWRFPQAPDNTSMIEVPFSEIILIAKHLNSRSVRNYLSANALRDVRDAATPAPEAVDASGRSPQRFIVEVVATRGHDRRSVVVQGRDIYAFTAPLICEALDQLLKPGVARPGAYPPGAILDAGAIIEALGTDDIDVQFSNQTMLSERQ